MISLFNEQELKDNYRQFKNNIETYVEGKRKDQLLDLHSKYEPRILNSPASTKIDRHNAFPGGYVDHVNNVVDLCLENYKSHCKLLDEENIDVDKNELVFSAIVHDLAKLGLYNKPHFIKQWKISRIKYGHIYVYNDDLSYAGYSDRTMRLLSKYNIDITENEFYAIRMVGGEFDEATKRYWNYYDSSLLPSLLYTSNFQAEQLEKAKYKEQLEAKLDAFLRDRTGGNVSLFDEGNNPEKNSDVDENVAGAVNNFFENMDKEKQEG